MDDQEIATEVTATTLMTEIDEKIFNQLINIMDVPFSRTMDDYAKADKTLTIEPKAYNGAHYKLAHTDNLAFAYASIGGMEHVTYVYHTNNGKELARKSIRRFIDLMNKVEEDKDIKLDIKSCIIVDTPAPNMSKQDPQTVPEVLEFMDRTEGNHPKGNDPRALSEIRVELTPEEAKKQEETTRMWEAELKKYDTSNS